MFAKTAFSNSPESVAPTRAAPSIRIYSDNLVERAFILRHTSQNERPRYDPDRRVCCEVHIQGVDDALEQLRHLDIK